MNEYKSHVSAILAEQGRSDRWFYRQMGVSESLFYHIERGTRRPSAEYRAKAAQLLGVPERLLFAPIVPSSDGNLQSVEVPA